MLLPFFAVTMTPGFTGWALSEAMSHTGLSRKAAAAAMDCDPAQVSRWIAGTGDVPDHRARRLPDETRIFYYELLAEDAGAVVTAGLTALLARLGFHRPVPVKAALPPQEERRYA